MKIGVHPSHQTRMDASSYDEICDLCGATDELGSWGRLAEPCSARLCITCPRCGMVSYHPKDIIESYCGNCHEFHDTMKETP